jgi:hypothetical protein
MCCFRRLETFSKSSECKSKDFLDFIVLKIMSFRDHYARREEYIPIGPAESPRVRTFATETLSFVKQHDLLSNDKARFLQYMKALTNDILGIELEEYSSKNQKSSPSHGFGSSSSGAGSSQSSQLGVENAFIPMHISADMREASNNSLGKMQTLRANIFANMNARQSRSDANIYNAMQQQDGASINNCRYGTEGAANSGLGVMSSTAASVAPVQHKKDPQLNANTPVDFIRKVNEQADPPEDNAGIENVVNTIPRTPQRDAFKLNSGASKPTSPNTSAGLTASSVPSASNTEKDLSKSSDAAPQHEVELDMSGNWKPERRSRAGSHSFAIASQSAAAEAAPAARDPQVQLPRKEQSILRNEIDLSAMTVHDVIELTGTYP